MLKKYRNAMLDVIRDAKLDPREFCAIDEDTVEDQRLCVQLVDTDLRFSFLLEFDEEGDRVFYYLPSEYTRGFPSSTYRTPDTFTMADDFDDVVTNFKAWLASDAQKYLGDKFELEEDRSLPDLWADLDLSLGSTEQTGSLQNSKFSSEEQERIAEALKKAEEEIQSRDLLDAEQEKLLHERIEYLVEASTRIGRKDWLMAAAGAVIGFTLQAGLASNIAAEVINLTGTALSWIGHTPLLLP